MPLNRRNILYALACVTGWPAAGWSAAQAQSPSPHPQPSPDTDLPAERVLGIGGIFFRSHDPKALADWYHRNLGITPVPTAYGQASWHTEAGTTVFAPFSETTKYLGAPEQKWMVNFRVRDLDKMAAQLRAAGTEVKIDPTKYPNGRFARTRDPEGNPIELWEPAGPNA
ncbi:MAG: VOC family protein [Acidobacteriaceae bacterium]